MRSLAILGALLVQTVMAYIPAVPTNDSSLLQNSNDMIHLAWLPNSIFGAALSRQLTASLLDAYGNVTTAYNASDPVVNPLISWTKYSSGALVHFSELNVSQAPSSVPWIALVNCDSNGTTGSFSMVNDIFTLARDRGAQASLLYSLTGQGCLINQDYIQNFEKVLDVYATTSLQAARTLESQFLNVGVGAYSYNSLLLNQSASIVYSLLNSSSLTVMGGNVPDLSAPTGLPVQDNATVDSQTQMFDSMTSSSQRFNPSTIASQSLFSLESASPTSGASPLPLSQRHLFARATTTGSAPPTSTTVGASYLAAVMAAANVTVGGTVLNGEGGNSTTAAGGLGSSGPSTALAMIILYVITGAVTLLFLAVIVSGAIRAMRNPERYGPNRRQVLDGVEIQQPQSRAQGLTRAILDTFPVVKFGSRQTENVGVVTGSRRRDVEEVDPDDEDANKYVTGTGAGTWRGDHGQAMEMADLTSSLPFVGADPRRRGDERMGMEDDEEQEAEERRKSVGSSSGFGTKNSTVIPPPAHEGEDAGMSPALGIHPSDVDFVTTCPICVCEFEEGEDVRILPCDRRHRFHRECIDPWLLQVSSHCPLCRADFSSPSPDPLSPNAPPPEEDPTTTAHGITNEQQVISNLRAMWADRRSTGVSSGTAMTTMGASHLRERSNGNGNGGGNGGTGTGMGPRNRFFRYVASRRTNAVRQGGDVGGERTGGVDASGGENGRTGGGE